MIFLQLLVILLLTRAFGEGAVRLGQPAVMGEVMAGVMLAAAVALPGPHLQFTTALINGEVFHHAATAGIFFLMLRAGIELKPREVGEKPLTSFAVALGGVMVPLAAGIGLGYLFLPPGDNRFALALLIGVVMSITSIPASVRILTDLGMLHTPAGRMIIAAALYDDVIGLVLLALLTALLKTGIMPSLAEFGWVFGKIAVFFAVTISLGVHVYPRVIRGLGTLQATSLELSALMVVAFAYGLLAEVLGMHWILGAFMAGLFFEPERVGIRAYDGLKLIIGGITAGLFAPVFFASIGARIDLGALTTAPLFLMAVIAAAFLGKLLGAGLPALAVGLGPRDSITVGVGMSGRGAVELVVLAIAVETGLITATPQSGAGTHPIYSLLVLMVLVTTLMVPSLLRALQVPRKSPNDMNPK
ncbi:MAG: Kef-type K+ transport system membrane component KefB [Alphaproteobacteria bacterium]|jgi:Kef-type K+ transport system membrane component KefB